VSHADAAALYPDRPPRDGETAWLSFRNETDSNGTTETLVLELVNATTAAYILRVSAAGNESARAAGPGAATVEVLTYEPPCIWLAFPLAVGNEWSTSCTGTRSIRVAGQPRLEANFTSGARLRVTGEETARVPAGAFTALRITELAPTGDIQIIWWAQDACGPVRRLYSSAAGDDAEEVATRASCAALSGDPPTPTPVSPTDPAPTPPTPTPGPFAQNTAPVVACFPDLTAGRRFIGWNATDPDGDTVLVEAFRGNVSLFTATGSGTQVLTDSLEGVRLVATDGRGGQGEHTCAAYPGDVPAPGGIPGFEFVAALLAALGVALAWTRLRPPSRA
jgi:hypothetical protein